MSRHLPLLDMTPVEAQDIVQALSKPSKMPGMGYGLPARECITGSKLRKVEGSVCHKCYAFRGHYMYPVVTNAQYNRLDSIDNPAWVEAIVTLIKDQVNPRDPYFRWHDSGDLQSVEHLEKIVEVCNKTRWVYHWLPTREYGIVKAWRLSGGRTPPNLAIRLSIHMVDGPVPKRNGALISSVSTDDSIYPKAHQCPSRHQGNKCRDCRACWDKKVYHVSYHKH